MSKISVFQLHFLKFSAFFCFISYLMFWLVGMLSWKLAKQKCSSGCCTRVKQPAEIYKIMIKIDEADLTFLTNATQSTISWLGTCGNSCYFPWSPVGKTDFSHIYTAQRFVILTDRILSLVTVRRRLEIKSIWCNLQGMYVWSLFANFSTVLEVNVTIRH